METKRTGHSTWLWMLGLLIIGSMSLLFIHHFENHLSSPTPYASEESQYWKKPIPLQGQAPEDHHLLAQGIHPQDCAKCHLEQYADWSESQHRHAMGPGMLGQYQSFSHQQQAHCNECHAPMSEQWPSLKYQGSWISNPDFDADLMKDGVTCAACHLRAHQRHSSPLDHTKSQNASLSEAIHGTPHRSPFFQASEFCKGCHQHTMGEKPGGKLIQNTYEEWLQSPAYAKGQSCQSCHMPERRHLWKGIHDPEMTRSGLEIETTVSHSAPKKGDAFEASLMIKSVNVGHAFPTYSTPAVFLKASVFDEAGIEIPGFHHEAVIQRRLSPQLDEEFDTRLFPQEARTLHIQYSLPPNAHLIKLWVWVEPDHFYEGFYQHMLSQTEISEIEKEAYSQALKETQSNQYELFSKSIRVVHE